MEVKVLGLGDALLNALLVLGLFAFFDWWIPHQARYPNIGTPLLKSEIQLFRTRYGEHRVVRLSIATMFAVVDALLAYFADEDYWGAFFVLMVLLYVMLVCYYTWCAEKDRTPWA